MNLLVYLITTSTIFPVLTVDCFCSYNKPPNIKSVTIRNPFPLNQFLNSTGISTNLNWEGFKCFDQGYGTTCDCDPECQLTGQCCIDFLWNHTEAQPMKMLTNPSALVDKYKDSVLATSTKDWSCLPLFPFTSLNVSFLMIDSCLPNANEMDIDLCISKSSSLTKREQMSVLGMDGILYKNRYFLRLFR